jgi:SAM-dependent methyltransferase
MEDKLKEAVKVYNKIATIYSEYNYDKIMQFQLTKFGSMLKGKKVLDAGCGVGRDVEYLMEDGFEVIGVDISKNMVAEAKKNVPKGKFEVMDFRKMKFKAKSFDGIWAVSSLIHLDVKGVKTALKEFFRVLDTGGILYVSLKEGEGSIEVKKEEYGKFVRHVFLYKEEDFKKLLEEAGFSIIESEVNLMENNVKWLEFFVEKKG